MKNVLITLAMTLGLATAGETGRVWFVRGAVPVDVTVTELIADKASDIDGDSIGVAIIDAYPGWEYSLNGGTSWMPVGDPSEASALLLSESARLRHDRSVLPMMTIRAWDQTAGTVGTYEAILATGGSTAFSEDTSWRAYVGALTEVDADRRLRVSVQGFDGVNNVAQINDPVYTVEPIGMGTWQPRASTDPGNVAGYFVPAGQIGPCVLTVTGKDKRGNPIATPGTLGIEVVAGPAERIVVTALEQVER